MIYKIPRAPGRPRPPNQFAFGGHSIRWYDRTHRPPGRARAARGHQWRRGGTRGAVKARNKCATEPRHDPEAPRFSPPTTPSAHWAHSGASMRRYGSPIARRRVRSRAADHPKMDARAASAAHARVAEAKKVLRTPNATQGRNFRSPIASSAPWGRPAAQMRSYGPYRTRKPPKSPRLLSLVADVHSDSFPFRSLPLLFFQKQLVVCSPVVATLALPSEDDYE